MKKVGKAFILFIIVFVGLHARTAVKAAYNPYNLPSNEFVAPSFTADNLDSRRVFILSPTGYLNLFSYDKNSNVMTVHELENKGSQSRRSYTIPGFPGWEYSIIHVYHVPKSTDVVIAMERWYTGNSNTTVYSYVLKWNSANNQYYLDTSQTKLLNNGPGRFMAGGKFGMYYVNPAAPGYAALDRTYYRANNTGYSSFMSINMLFNIDVCVGGHALWVLNAYASGKYEPYWYPEVTAEQKAEIGSIVSTSGPYGREFTGAIMAISGSERSQVMMYHTRRTGEYIYTNPNGEAVYDLLSIDRGLDLDLENYNEYPNINIKVPFVNQAVGSDPILSPSIEVSDINGDPLTCKYYIDGSPVASDVKNVSNTKTVQLVNFNALNASALTEGEHVIKFEVCDGVFDPMTQSVSFKVDRTAPNLFINVTDGTMSSINVSVTASDDLSGLGDMPYRYILGSQDSGWTNETSYRFFSLYQNAQYKIVYQARDKVGNISATEQLVYTKAQVPSVSGGTPTENGLDVLISDGNPAYTQYQIIFQNMYVNQSGYLTSIPSWITVNSKKVSVLGLGQNTSYPVKVKAKNGDGIETAFSGEITATTLASPPTNITFTPTQTSMTIRWDAVSGALSYDVEVDSVVVSNITDASYFHTGLSAETSHNYRIRVKNAAGTGSWSGLITKSTYPYPPSTPVNFFITSVSQRYISLSWEPCIKATEYMVEANGTVIGTYNTTSMTHQDLSPDTTYTYRVKAKNIGGESTWSDTLTETTWPDIPDVPVNISIIKTNESVTVSWDQSSRAADYEIEADGAIISTKNATTYLHEGLHPLTQHTYRVRAVNRGGKSAWSTPISVTTNPDKPTMPNNIMATSDKDSITLTWYLVPYAESYDVEIDGQEVKTSTELSYRNMALTADSTHSYRVRARNVTGSSEWSSPVTASTLPDSGQALTSITNVVAIVTNSYITIAWDDVEKDAGYLVEVDGVLQDIGKDKIYNHTGLSANQYHTYKVKAKTTAGQEYWCAVLSLSTLPNPPDAPTGVEAVPRGNSIELRWSKAGEDVTYDIEVDGQVIDNGASMTYNHEGLASGTSHTYRVRAKNITGVTAWSSAITKSTTSPTYTVNCTKDKGFDLSLLASNVQDFTGLSFVVTYNKDELDVIDLCGFTPGYDILSQEKIQGTNLYVTYTPGRIEFTLKENIIPGTSWSGEITNILFKAKVSGQSNMDIKVEQQ